MNDINERINELIKLNEDLENYFANTSVTQIFVDADLKLRKYTPSATKHFKLVHSDVGKSLSEISSNQYFSSVIKYIRRVMVTEEGLQKEIQTIDARWYQMDVLPYIVRKENRTNGVIISFTDITSRIRDLKEQERLTSENELLLDTIAHDVKNQLSALSAAVEMLKRPLREQVLTILIKNIQGSLVNMNKVFSDLTESRSTGNRYDALGEPVNLEHILDEVKDSLTPQIKECSAVFTIDLEVLEIVFQKRKLRSIMYNLISNALKYSSLERTPEIVINSHRQETFIIITVSDNGIGFDVKHQVAIFEKYRQLDQTAEGDGVGLYLVKTMLEKCGGKIFVESGLEYGTTFKVYLPPNEP